MVSFGPGNNEPFDLPDPDSRNARTPQNLSMRCGPKQCLCLEYAGEDPRSIMLARLTDTSYVHSIGALAQTDRLLGPTISIGISENLSIVSEVMSSPICLPELTNSHNLCHSPEISQELSIVVTINDRIHPWKSRSQKAPRRSKQVNHI
jgi:hypothetical protein